RSLQGFFGREAPEPVLARLEALHDHVAGRLGVAARVLRGGGVAAPDVPAQGAPPQVEPPAALRLALDAAAPARRHGRIDLALLAHHAPPSRVASASSQWARVAAAS